MPENCLECRIVAVGVQPKVASDGDVDDMLHYDARRVGATMNVEFADAAIAAVARDLSIDECCNRRIVEPRSAVGIGSIGAQERDDSDRTAGRSLRKPMRAVIGRARCDDSADARGLQHYKRLRHRKLRPRLPVVVQMRIEKRCSCDAIRCRHATGPAEEQRAGEDGADKELHDGFPDIQAQCNGWLSPTITTATLSRSADDRCVLRAQHDQRASENYLIECFPLGKNAV